jgi:hypothetical protein
MSGISQKLSKVNLDKYAYNGRIESSGRTRVNWLGMHPPTGQLAAVKNSNSYHTSSSQIINKIHMIKIFTSIFKCSILIMTNEDHLSNLVAL